jgi:hypothetical protein
VGYFGHAGQRRHQPARSGCILSNSARQWSASS